MVEFFIVFKNYFIEVLPFLAIGFFLSGLIHEFVPSHWVERHLGGRGIRPIAKAALGWDYPSYLLLRFPPRSGEPLPEGGKVRPGPGFGYLFSIV